MSMHSDSDMRDDALSDEERALAERLARTAPQRGPSAAIDADILAAARAAVAAPASATSPPRRRRPRRWPAITGVAAMLMLALGLAWQLRPVDQMQMQVSEPAPAGSRARGGHGGPSADENESRAPAETAQARAQPAVAAEAPPADMAEKKYDRAVDESDRANATTVAEDAAAPAAPHADVLYLPAMSPPPPPPPRSAPQAVAPAPAVSAPAPLDAVVAGDRGEAASKPAPAPELRRADADAREPAMPQAAPAEPPVSAVGVDAPRVRDTDETAADTTAAGGFADQPLDDEPPASADSPAVRDAWLQRVRDLLAHGDRAAARDSLREYQRRHPDAAIPDDLRALLSE